MNKKIAIGLALLAGAGLMLAYFNPWRQPQGDDGGEAGVGGAAEPVARNEEIERARVVAEDMHNRLSAVMDRPDPPVAREVLGNLERMMASCPPVERHLAQVLSEGDAKIVFSDRAKDAMYSSSGNPITKVPPHVIILPSNTKKSPADLVDAFLFESCNAKNQARYNALTELRRERLDEDPISIIDYGIQKATIEADTTLDHVKLLVQVRDSGVEISYQGHRNLFAMLRTCLQHQGRDIENYEAILNDEERIVEALDEHHEELHRLLMETETDAALRNALLLPTLNSPHKREAVEPWDTGQLSTQDLYAYELLETWTVPNVLKMMTHGIDELLGADEETIDAINDYIKDRLDLFEKGDPVVEGVDDVDGQQMRSRAHDMRVGNIIKIIEDLKVLYPELDGHDFAAVALTPKMQEVAEARRANWMQEPPKGFKVDLQNKGMKCIEVLNGALSSTISFAEKIPANLVKDTRPVLRDLAGWTSVPAVEALRLEIEAAQNGDPPRVPGNIAERVQQQFYEVIPVVLTPYNEAIEAVHFEERTPEEIVDGLTALNEAVAALPDAVKSKMKIHLALLVSVAVDLQAIFPSENA